MPRLRCDGLELSPEAGETVLDALKPLGVTDIDMPATPARVWETIQRANGGAGARA